MPFGVEELELLFHCIRRAWRYQRRHDGSALLQDRVGSHVCESEFVFGIVTEALSGYWTVDRFQGVFHDPQNQVRDRWMTLGKGWVLSKEVQRGRKITDGERRLQ